MTYTENYALNQWAKTDRLMMSDFNADNAKIDATLKSNADALAAETAARAAAVAACGNCRIVTGTYTGTGKYGSDNKNTLTFESTPYLVLIGSGSYQMLAQRKVGKAYTYISTNILVSCTATWGDDNTFSWYNSASATNQLNMEGGTYRYIAFLASN